MNGTRTLARVARPAKRRNLRYGAANSPIQHAQHWRRTLGIGELSAKRRNFTKAATFAMAPQAWQKPQPSQKQQPSLWRRADFYICLTA